MIVAAVLICLTGGLVAGTIAHSKTGSFLGFFIFGAMLPIIGVVVACLVKPAVAAGWFQDPYRQAAYRWFDGADWTAYTV